MRIVTWVVCLVVIGRPRRQRCRSVATLSRGRPVTTPCSARLTCVEAPFMRNSFGNPLREVVFARLHRATRELSIQRKIRLLPKIAAFAMFAILVMTIGFGMLSRRSTARIRDGYYPSARLSADLRQRLAVMQRRLQDGVMAKQREPFKDAEVQLDSALRELDAAGNNPVAEPAKIDALRAAIRGYHTVARRTSERMLAGETGDSIVAAARTMTSQYAALRRELETNAAADEARIDGAFTSASRLQLATSAAIGLLALGAVTFLWLLSLFTEDLLTRTLTDPLGEAA